MSPSPFTDPSPEWVHIVCGTDRAKAMVHERETIRICSNDGSGEDQAWSGKLVWEPMPVCLANFVQGTSQAERGVEELCPGRARGVYRPSAAYRGRLAKLARTADFTINQPIYRPDEG